MKVGGAAAAAGCWQGEGRTGKEAGNVAQRRERGKKNFKLNFD